MRVKKRDGSLQTFDINRVKRSIVMAFDSVGEQINVMPIVNEVCELLRPRDTVGNGDVSETIENCLMEGGHFEAARSFIEYRTLRTKYRGQRLVPDNTAISDYIHISKYAKGSESYHETVERTVRMHVARWPELESEIRSAFEFVHGRLCLPSMRCMQFAGPAIEAHNERIFNCSFTLVDRPEVFGEIFYLLLCGCGVGYSVQWKHIEKLPTLAKGHSYPVLHHTVEDNIEGWGDAVKVLLEAAIRGQYVEYNYSKIRPEGTPLVTSGGKAPGHLPLKRALESCRGILQVAAGRQLRPIECHDMICFLAEAVLSGGIRRSSLLSLFSLSDTEMLYSKTAGVFCPGGQNNQRCMANNSVSLKRDTVTRADFQRVIRLSQEGYGEPGFFFSDHEDWGTNPCGEITLDPVADDGRTEFGFCNLTEINISKIMDLETAVAVSKAAAFIGTLQAAYTDFRYINSSVARRDALLGVSLTGIMDNPGIGLSTEVLKAMRQSILEENKRVAAMIGIREAVRLTCVKPSGTASLELGSISSGIHPRHARRYFRRVTGNLLEPAVQRFMETNPHMVEYKPNGDVALVFPIEAPGSAIISRDLTGSMFLRNVLTVLEYYVGQEGHNVSCTVTIRDDIDEVVEIVWNNKARFASLAFASEAIDKLYPFAPFEAVTTAADEGRWNNLISCYRVVDYAGVADSSDKGSACEGPSCSL